MAGLHSEFDRVMVVKIPLMSDDDDDGDLCLSDGLSSSEDECEFFSLSTPREIEIDVDEDEELEIIIQREIEGNEGEKKNQEIISEIMKETEFNISEGRGLMIKLGKVEGWKRVELEPSGRIVTAFKIRVNIVRIKDVEEETDEETEGEEGEDDKGDEYEVVSEWVIHRTDIEFKILKSTVESISKLFKKKRDFPPFKPNYKPPQSILKILKGKKSKLSKKKKEKLVPVSLPPSTTFPSGFGEKAMKKNEFLLMCLERLTSFLEELLEYFNSTDLLEYWATTKFSNPERKDRVRHLIDTIFGFIKITECPCFYIFENTLERNNVAYFHFFDDVKKRKFTVKKRLNENEFRLRRVNTKLLEYLLPNKQTGNIELNKVGNLASSFPPSNPLGSSVIDKLTKLGLGNSEIGEWETKTKSKLSFMESELRRMEVNEGNAFVTVSVPGNQFVICAILPQYDKVFFFPLEEVKKCLDDIFTQIIENDTEEDEGEEEGEGEGEERSSKKKRKSSSPRSRSPRTSPRSSPRSSPRTRSPRRKKKRRTSFSDLFFDTDTISSLAFPSQDVQQSYAKIAKDYSQHFPFHIFEHFQISCGRRAMRPFHIREFVQSHVVDYSFRGDDFEPIRMDLLRRDLKSIPDLPEHVPPKIKALTNQGEPIPSASKVKKQQLADEKVKSDFLAPRKDVSESIEILTRDGREISVILSHMKSDYTRRRERLITKMKNWITLKRTPYNENNPIHETLLENMWKGIFHELPYERFSTRWQSQFGFQGSNPATDFRGMGILTLKNLVYFANCHREYLRFTLVQQREYPYSCACVAVSQILVNIFGLEIKNIPSKSSASNGNHIFDPSRSPIFDFLVTNMKDLGENVLEEFFCVMMKFVDRLFVDRKLKYSQFPELMRSVVRKICHIFSSSNKNSYPMSFKRLEYILNVDDGYKDRKPANPQSVIAQDADSGKIVELEFRTRKILKKKE